MIATLMWELRQRRTALLWWTIGSVVLAVLILSLYPSIRDQANQLNQVINTLPQGLRELKSGGATSVNVADPVQFLNSQLFYASLPIVWIILAITRGSAVLGREEQNHTIELLLARPISRSSLLLTKALSIFIEFAIVASATVAAIALVAPHVDLNIGIGRLIITTLYTAAFSLSFGLIAFTLQSVGRLTRRADSVTAVILGFGGYLLASLSSLTDWLRVPSKFAPYHYFAPDKILHGLSVTGLNVYLLSALVLGVAVSFLAFRRRDIS